MFEHVFTIPVSADEALAAHRDGLPAFGPQLPGLKEIRVASRSVEGATQVLTHEWIGDRGVLPTVVQRLVRPEHVSWWDHSQWDAARLTGTWAVHIPVLGSEPQIRGTHRFVDVPGGCEVRVRATLSFVADADARLLGVRMGRWVASLLERAVQDLFVAMITHSGDVVADHVAARRTARAA